MITKEKLHRYNLIKDDEIVKEYCKLLDEIFNETNKIKEEHKKNGFEYYKSSNIRDYYIEKPYKDLDYSNKKGGYYYRQRGYSYIGKSKVNSSTLYGCLGLCKYDIEEIKEMIDKAIKEDNDLGSDKE